MLYTKLLFPKGCLSVANQILEINDFMENFIVIKHKWEDFVVVKLELGFWTHIRYFHWGFIDICNIIVV